MGPLDFKRMSKIGEVALFAKWIFRKSVPFTAVYFGTYHEFTCSRRGLHEGLDTSFLVSVDAEHLVRTNGRTSGKCWMGAIQTRRHTTKFLHCYEYSFGRSRTVCEFRCVWQQWIGLASRAGRITNRNISIVYHEHGNTSISFDVERRCHDEISKW